MIWPCNVVVLLINKTPKGMFGDLHNMAIIIGWSC